jgi:hypothetical protein
MREKVTMVENIAICMAQSIRDFEGSPIVKITAKPLIPIFLISLATPQTDYPERARPLPDSEATPGLPWSGLSWQGSDAPRLICVKMRSRTYSNLDKSKRSERGRPDAWPRLPISWSFLSITSMPASSLVNLLDARVRPPRYSMLKNFGKLLVMQVR